MEHLDEISVEELQTALDNVEGKKPTERLLAAIAYKNGVSQEELAEWYDVHRKTIYNWLKRLDADESLEHAVANTHRSGRNRKLSGTQHKSSKKLSTTRLKRLGSTRRRGRRRSSSSFSKRRTASSTPIRTVDGC